MVSGLTAHSWSPSELKRQLEEERRGEPFLVYRDAGGEQRIQRLAGTSRITVGRGPSDVRLADDAAVSWLHAELERIADDWLVVDDGLSRNGSFVNDERVVGRRRLRDGDAVRIGRTTMIFRSPAQREAEGTRTDRGSVAAPPASLSETQRRVLAALCRPLAGEDRYAMPATNQAIADEVFLSVDRVKAHLRTLFERFGVEGLPQNQKRAALARRALDGGVISERDLR